MEVLVQTTDVDTQLHGVDRLVPEGEGEALSRVGGFCQDFVSSSSVRHHPHPSARPFPTMPHVITVCLLFYTP